MKTNGNDSVVPYSVLHADGSVYEQHIGLTKREYFAAMGIAIIAVSQADALIEALNK